MMKSETTKHTHKDIPDDQVSPPAPLPVLPLRDVVIYPYMIYPVLVGRESSLRAAAAAIGRDKTIFLVAQKNDAIEEPGKDEIYTEGTVAKIIQTLRLPNGLMKILVDGQFHATITSFTGTEEFLEADVTPVPNHPEVTQELDALMRHVTSLFSEYAHLNRSIPGEAIGTVSTMKDPRRKLYFIAANISQSVEAKQKILQQRSITDQYLELIRLLGGELDVLKIEKDIDSRVQDSIQKSQRRFLIQEQIRVLLEELGEEEAGSPELLKLKKEIDEAGMPEEAFEKAIEEFNKLKKTPPQSPEFGVSRNYLDWMVNVPWKKRTEDLLDVSHVETVLNEDHFGLEKPKERILEHIAVLNLVKETKGQILCFVGPPGVGKTSLGKSIARALGRRFVRISLGGVRDEAEIRGHRRTYIGSMPGKIIQSMKRAGVVNPVVLMDEIDKMSADFRGDPAAALLEVLDPEQNSTFNDHYLDLDYDLSHVMFITTANVRFNIPLPLQDRMELIELPGYLDFEKREIAARHLIPKQLAAHGLKPEDLSFAPEAVDAIIHQYTREAGVRNLEREIASVCRKVAREIVTRNQTKSRKSTMKNISIDPKRVEKLLGVPKFRNRSAALERRVGSVVGLAWTSAGGEILDIDVAIINGTERLTLTGQLGDIMKESAQAALSYLRAHHKMLHIPEDFHVKKEIHVHLPEGAIPKDGPSAGLSLAMAMISAASGRPARSDVAMTGEITLRGKVLAIGGLNEKLLAARRSGITTIIIPKENEKDLAEIPAKVKEGLRIICVETIAGALKWVFDAREPR